MHHNVSIQLYNRRATVFHQDLPQKKKGTGWNYHLDQPVYNRHKPPKG